MNRNWFSTRATGRNCSGRNCRMLAIPFSATARHVPYSIMGALLAHEEIPGFDPACKAYMNPQKTTHQLLVTCDPPLPPFPIWCVCVCDWPHLRLHTFRRTLTNASPPPIRPTKPAPKNRSQLAPALGPGAVRGRFPGAGAAPGARRAGGEASQLRGAQGHRGRPGGGRAVWAGWFGRSRTSGLYQNRFGIPFWRIGEFTTHFRTYSGDWDVHWEVKSKPGIGPQVLVHVSTYHGSIFGTYV